MKDTTTVEAGSAIARAYRWDINQICAVFLEALTDSNAHELRKALEQIINEGA